MENSNQNSAPPILASRLSFEPLLDWDEAQPCSKFIPKRCSAWPEMARSAAYTSANCGDSVSPL